MSNEACFPVVLRQFMAGEIPPGPNGFRWRDGRLRYVLPRRGTPYHTWERFAEPSNANWDWFWTECDKSGIWKVPADFMVRMEVTPGGVLVNTALEHGGRSIRLYGTLSSPNQVEIEVEATEALMRVHLALQRLVWLSDAKNT